MNGAEWRDPGHRPLSPSVSIFSDFCSHPPDLPHTPLAACWWERVATTSIQASVALERRPLGCAGSSGRLSPRAPAAVPEDRDRRWAGSRQARKRRRRMAARQLNNLEDVAAMRRFPHPGLSNRRGKVFRAPATSTSRTCPRLALAVLSQLLQRTESPCHSPSSTNSAASSKRWSTRWRSSAPTRRRIWRSAAARSAPRLWLRSPECCTPARPPRRSPTGSRPPAERRSTRISRRRSGSSAAIMPI